jgi:hypothetical protein
LAKEIRSFEILSVKKEAKFSASDEIDMYDGKGDDDLRWRRLFIVCQRRRGLSEDEETKLEKYSFLEDRISLW